MKKEIKLDISFDSRIEIAMLDQRTHDKSFTDKGLFGMTPKFSQSEVREIWLSGIKYGMEQGLYMASLEGQRININNNIKNERQKEFYNKFLELANKYECAIQYHPSEGMCVIDTSRNIDY